MSDLIVETSCREGEESNHNIVGYRVADTGVGMRVVIQGYKRAYRNNNNSDGRLLLKTAANKSSQVFFLE